MSENNINDMMWKSQYQNLNQTQSMINFLQFQQAMMENMAKFGGLNQLNNFQGVQGGANNNPPQAKEEYINLCFATVQGSRIMMKFKPEETIDSVLEKYLLRVNLPDLINKIDGKISFILSAQSLKFGDKRKLKDVVIMGGLNQILVNDIGNLIGAF